MWQELTLAHEKLRSGLDGQDRKLLRLTNVESALRDAASLHSFIAGYRLTFSIQQELFDRPIKFISTDFAVISYISSAQV